MPVTRQNQNADLVQIAGDTKKANANSDMMNQKQITIESVQQLICSHIANQQAQHQKNQLTSTNGS